jgi:hypothetical protein
MDPTKINGRKSALKKAACAVDALVQPDAEQGV